MATHFDESLPRLCELVAERFGDELLSRASILRDAGGRLSLILPEPKPAEEIELLESKLKASLGAYARPDGVVVNSDYPGAETLLEEAGQQPITIVGPHSVRLLDRRVIGLEWLRDAAVVPSGKVPRIVFSSLKGGVGRSTALCVAAAHLSRKGRRVLTIDFDLEAPGIGSMLLDEHELPEYGMLDYLVEAGLSNVDDEFVVELTGDSYLGSGGARVSVVPAIGRRTLDHPENALAKLARAYLDVPQEVGPPKSITDQLSALLARYDALGAYDVVLVDGRSGLHETTASLILGIGAEVLLFGLDQPQTFQGYRLLVGQLAQYRAEVFEDWRDRVSFVHAKAPDSVEARNEVASKFESLLHPLARHPRLDQTANEKLTENDFDLDWQEGADLPIEEQETQVLYVLDDSRYRHFDPVLDRKILDARSYATAFSSLLEYIDSLVLEPSSEEIEDQPQ
ncbi:MAG TPA: hypothetical protein VNK51_08175 [Bradyrhizobium sp.]|nr:hypothetical protein [Bradyrhizobium sp.]